MKEKNKKYNIVIASLLILALNLNCFAAIVSDNDGSAFVTKSEFESLKKDFAEQVGNYNNSIDSKIDGAISAYLAGIKIEKQQSLSTVMKSWEDVTMRNYELGNQYGYPKVDFQYAWYGAGHGSNWNHYPSAYGLAATGNGSSVESKIKFVGLKEGEETDYNDITKNKFYWGGYITDYEEKISMGKLGYSNSTDVASAFYDVALSIYDIVKLSTIGNQYFTSSEMSNFWSSKWLPTIKWTGKGQAGGASGAEVNPAFAGGFFNWSSTYHAEKITNKYELTWQSIDENIINPDFNHCFYTFGDNTRSSKNIYDSITLGKAGSWIKLNNLGSGRAIPDAALGTKTSSTYDADHRGSAYEWGFIESHYNPTALNASIYDWARGSTSGGQYPIPTLGGLGAISSDSIYLQKNDLLYTFKNKDYVKNITTMNDGLPLIFATKDSKLTWQCVFMILKARMPLPAMGK